MPPDRACAAPAEHPQCEAPHSTQPPPRSSAVTLPGCGGTPEHPSMCQLQLQVPCRAPLSGAPENDPGLQPVQFEPSLSPGGGGLFYGGPWDPPAHARHGSCQQARTVSAQSQTTTHKLQDLSHLICGNTGAQAQRGDRRLCSNPKDKT